MIALKSASTGKSCGNKTTCGTSLHNDPKVIDHERRKLAVVLLRKQLDANCLPCEKSPT